MTNSIIRRQTKQKVELLEKLKETPIVELACRKVGVARATYYRWRVNDEKFAKEAELSLEAGSALVNDMAENQLLIAIKEQNMTAIIYWLNHHHPAYATKIEVTAKQVESEKLTSEQEKIVAEALAKGSLLQSEILKTDNHG